MHYIVQYLTEGVCLLKALRPLLECFVDLGLSLSDDVWTAAEDVDWLSVCRLEIEAAAAIAAAAE